MKENIWKSGSTNLRTVPHFNRNSFVDIFPYLMPSVIAIQDLELVSCFTEAVLPKQLLKINYILRFTVTITGISLSPNLVCNADWLRGHHVKASRDILFRCKIFALSIVDHTLLVVSMSFVEYGWKLLIQGVFKFRNAISAGCTNALILVAEQNFNRKYSVVSFMSLILDFITFHAYMSFCTFHARNNL